MAIFTLYYSPKESSLKERPEGSHWFECSLYLILSPKGEFSLRGVPLVEWLSLPYIMGKNFLPPYEASKTFLLLDGRADGRADGRDAGRAGGRAGGGTDKRTDGRTETRPDGTADGKNRQNP